jgi:hypothetical protein
MAEAAFAVQIETERIRQLCVSHQQFTGAKKQDVGTLLMSAIYLGGRYIPRSRLVEVKISIGDCGRMTYPEIETDRLWSYNNLAGRNERGLYGGSNHAHG